MKSGYTGPDLPALMIDGKLYGGWTDLRVTRGIERCAADFVLHISERWPGQEESWPIRPFATSEICFDDDVVITGYVDGVQAATDSSSRSITVSGRSKTADLIDCCALIQGGEFRDSEFAAICRSVGAPFGVGVLDNAQVGRVVIPTSAADQTEKCFEFLERLARQASVLLTDDAQGRLVIARTGDGVSATVLEEGVNLLSASITMEVEKRFDRYIVKGQLPATASWIPEAARVAGEGRRPGGDARPNVTGEIRDAAVPRYRPFIMQAEGNADPAQARARALWQQRRDAAESLNVKVSVQGWRQEDGRLWTINERVLVVIPSFGLKEELLVATVSHTLSNRDGRQTLLTLGQLDAFTPEPIAESGGGGGSGRGWVAGLPANGGRDP